MEKKLIPFDKIIFMDPEDKQYNIPKVSNKEKKSFYFDLKSKGFYNGCLKSIINYDLDKNVLKMFLARTNFFDLMLSRKINQNLMPVLAVNAIIETEGQIVFIKRGEEVYEYCNCTDFPAGLVSCNEFIQERLFNRINADTKLNESDLTIGELIPCAIILDKASFNLFYKVKYKGSKKELENFFSKNFESQKPFLVKKDEILTFFKEDNKPLFFEILKFI